MSSCNECHTKLLYDRSGRVANVTNTSRLSESRGSNKLKQCHLRPNCQK